MKPTTKPIPLTQQLSQEPAPPKVACLRLFRSVSNLTGMSTENITPQPGLEIVERSTGSFELRRRMGNMLHVINVRANNVAAVEYAPVDKSA